jgi:hypothetical protein
MSNILPLIIGAINEKEVHTSATLKCPKKTDENKESLSKIEVDVLYPPGAGKVVPLIGGSVVRLTLGQDALSVDDNLKSKYDTIKSRYKTKSLDEFLESVSGGDPDESSGFQAQAAYSVSELSVAINRLLEGAPNISRRLHTFKIPSIKISNVSNPSLTSVDLIDKEIDKKKEVNGLISGIEEVGSLKYIPIELIVSIFKKIEKYHNNPSISGFTFGDISEVLTSANLSADSSIDANTESILSDAILSIFPIIRIDEDIILSEDNKDVVGFYTIVGDKAYMKMPDLSGRDASGFSSNIYGLGDEDPEYFGCLFELSMKKEYSAKAFDYKSPPQIEITHNEFSIDSLDQDASDSISINTEGVELGESYKYYLSPILPGGGGVSAVEFGGAGIADISDGIEAFTFPNISKPSSGGLPIVALSKSVTDSYKESYPYNSIGIEKYAKSAEEVIRSVYGQSDDADAAFKTTISTVGDGIVVRISDLNGEAGFGYPIDSLGVSPASKSLNDIGINSGSQVLGLSGRPDPLLGRRDGRSTHIRNNSKYFGKKIYAAKELLASINPSIAVEGKDTIPRFWVPHKSIKRSGDNYEISFKDKTDAKSIGLDFFSQEREYEFALYAVDSLGQVSRAPGLNVKLLKQQNVILSLEPDGFYESGKILTVDSTVKLTVATDVISRVTSIELFDQSEGGSSLGQISPDEVTISGTNVIIPNFSVTGILGPGIFGTFWLEINGDKNRLAIYIAPVGTEDKELLPERPPKKVLFTKDKDFNSSIFGKRIDSIPVLMDGSNNAEIRLSYKDKVFEEGNELYAYFAFLGNDSNKKILTEDVCWTHGSGGLGKLNINDNDYLIPTNIEYGFNSAFFQSISKRRAVIRFPGPAASLNISRLSQITGDKDNFPGFIIVSNKRISPMSTDGGDPQTVLLDSDFAKIPIGAKNNEASAFADPPYVYGLMAKLPGRAGGGSYATNMDLGTAKDFERYTKGINFGKLKTSGIVSSDGLDRLSVLFSGSTTENMVSKRYTAYIGSKKIKGNRKGLIRKTKTDNVLCANYKNISSISDAGWTEVRVSKRDKRFNVTYDSTLYNFSTINFSCDADENCPDILKGDDSGRMMLASGKDKRFFNTEPDNNVLYMESSSLFPSANASGLSPIPYAKDGEINKNNKVQKVLDGNTESSLDAYSFFRNPIKIYPGVDLVLGEVVGSPEKAHGVFLSDIDITDPDNMKGEIAKMSTNGRSDVPPNLDLLESAVDDMKEGVTKLKANIAGEIDDLNSQLEEARDAGEDTASIEAEILSKKEEDESLDKAAKEADEALEAARGAEEASEQAEAEAAAQAVDSAGEGSDAIGDDVTDALESAADAAKAAADAANEAAAKLEAAVAMAQALLDALSRIAMLANAAIDEIEDSLSSFGSRESDFYGINLANIFIDKNASINTALIKSEFNTFRLNIKTRFEQTSAIKFNVPEIIQITHEGTDYLPSAFGDLSVTAGLPIILKTIGTNRDTKVEVNKIRIAKKIDAEDGIFKDLKITIKTLEAYTLISDCLELSITNGNENRLRAGRQLGNNLTIDLDKKWKNNISGGNRNKQGRPGELREKLKDNYLKFTSVTLDAAGVAKEFLQSFCDMSFHLTAELSLQLRNFKVLLIPIKVILCIIDVICALLHPIRLAFAIIRLFLCLYDLILLLPQLSVPAMLLALLLHIIELLLCVIIKVLSIVNAINEIIAALETAIEEKDYPAIAALEETINEHIFSLEADLSVLEPILQILALFLELLQLVFAFPCQIGSDDDAESCIDPSQLAGIIIGKIAPSGRIEPDALLPMAQSYTTLGLNDIGTKGNTPESSVDDGNNVTTASGGSPGADILKETRESSGASVVSDNSGSDYAGNDLTGLTSSSTGLATKIEDGGFFKGDINEDGRLDNIDYTKLRFDEGFEATFGLSFTKSKKEFNLFTGPDPRLVKFEFNERGLTNSLAFNWFLSLFFKKKNIDDLQTLDSPPGFVVPDGGSKLIVNRGVSGFTSPVDGASDVGDDGSFSGFFLDKIGNTYQPKPLTLTFELNEPSVNPDTLDAEFVPRTVSKTFPGIPMIALIDDEFNVYFIQETEDGGGITVESDGGVDCITSISAKMINFPTAPKKRFSREGVEVYRGKEEISPKSDRGKGGGFTGGIPLGQEMVYEQANANWILSSTAVSGEYTSTDEIIQTSKFNGHFGGAGTAEEIKEALLDPGAQTIGKVTGPIADPGDPPFPEYRVYDWANGSKNEQNDFGEAIDEVKVFDFPRLYIIDMRHLADDIASACGASGPTNLLMSLPVFSEEGQDGIDDLVNRTRDCVEGFRGMFLSEDDDGSGAPVGIIPKIKLDLSQGSVPKPISVEDIVRKYDDFRKCLEGVTADTCKYVLNPLNTTFRILDDEDNTPLSDYIDPEQQNLANLINYDIVDELEFDDELAGFPKITGAMEYASGIGDMATINAGDKALIRIVPRDCYDDTLPPSLDLSESIKIEFIKDDTDGAKLVAPYSSSEDIFVNADGEYTFAVTAPSAGHVQIKATVCSVIIQAVTDRSILSGESDAQVDCVDDGDIMEEEDSFAPGELTKVDRILNILFVKNNNASNNYGDSDRNNNERSAIPSPQTFGTNLEN